MNKQKLTELAIAALTIEEGDEAQIKAENQLCEAADAKWPGFEQWCHQATAKERIIRAGEVLGLYEEVVLSST